MEKPTIIIRMKRENINADIELSVKKWNWEKGCSTLIVPNASKIVCSKPLPLKDGQEAEGGCIDGLIEVMRKPSRKPRKPGK